MDNATLIKLWKSELDIERLKAIEVLIEKSLNKLQGHETARIMAVERRQAEEVTQIINMEEVA